MAELRRANELLGEVPSSLAELGYALGKTSEKAEAEKILARMLRSRESGYYPAFAIALVELGLGRRDAAIEWMERAVDERLTGYYMASVDPDFDSVRDDPRFQRLVRRIGF